jgi:hypothetical protein
MSLTTPQQSATATYGWGIAKNWELWQNSIVIGPVTRVEWYAPMFCFTSISG